MFPPFYSFMFAGVPIFISITFIFIFGIIIFRLISVAKEWKYNNNSPILSVEATVVAKRTNVRHHNHQNMQSSSSTTYYVTFQFESGDRMEFRVHGTEYGILIEQDKGKLSFQGTRYLGFKRM